MALGDRERERLFLQWTRWYSLRLLLFFHTLTWLQNHSYPEGLSYHSHYIPPLFHSHQRSICQCIHGTVMSPYFDLLPLCHPLWVCSLFLRSLSCPSVVFFFWKNESDSSDGTGYMFLLVHAHLSKLLFFSIYALAPYFYTETRPLLLLFVLTLTHSPVQPLQQTSFVHYLKQ